jgi:hypothetical protein
MFTPPSAQPTSLPFAPPPGPPAFASAPPPLAPAGPAFAAPPAAPLYGSSPMTPRGPDSPVGPPELRLYSNEPGERAEPYAPPPLPSSAPAPRAVGPSDFTRMLTPVEVAPSAPAPPAVKPNARPDAAAGGRKPSLLPLIIVLMFAFVAAATLILYFVLKK